VQKEQQRKTNNNLLQFRTGIFNFCIDTVQQTDRKFNENNSIHRS